MRRRYCKRHAKPVGWQCSRCSEFLCPECVATRTVHVVNHDEPVQGLTSFEIR